MDHGIKISKRGENVIDEFTSPKVKSNSDAKKILPHLLYGIALAYLAGARLQVTRYKEAVKTKNAAEKVILSIHEMSCLFEDLATVAKYAEMCGDVNELHRQWFDIRNHLRHDVREEIDNEDSKLKVARAKRLGINPKLQMQIGIEENAIKIGSTTIELTTIESYLAWADLVITGVLKDASTKGYVKGLSFKEG